MIEIPVRGNRVAMVDEIDYKNVKDYNWGFMKGKGVASFGGKQTILMHSLISPYSRVSFKDGNKLNCQRDNLVPWKTLRKTIGAPRKATKGNICHHKGKFFFEVHRSVTVNGERLYWRTSVRYEKFRTMEQAYELAKEKAIWINSMTRENFIQYVLSGRKKKTTHEIISDWSCFEDREYSTSEYYEMGVTSKPERFY